MDLFVYFLLQGLCTGAIYALVALGYTLVYGIIKLINFAHGEFYMAGAYAGFGVWCLLRTENADGSLGDLAVSPWLAVPVVVLVSGLAGAVIAVVTERVAYRPIRRSGRLAALLTAIGVSFLLQNLFGFIENGNPLTYTGVVNDLAQAHLDVGGSGVKWIQILFIPVSAVLAGGLWWLVMRTRFGRAMRAVSQDADAAALMGIDTDRVIRRTFLAGGFLAGVAGTLVAMQSVVKPMMGFLPGLNAFVAAVVGGIGSVPGAVLGGFLLGVVQNMALWAGVPSGYRDVASFVVLIIVLVARPQGILGRIEREKV